jgi:hypothetical protein
MNGLMMHIKQRDARLSADPMTLGQTTLANLQYQAHSTSLNASTWISESL